MTDAIEVHPRDEVAQLVEFFCNELERLRPGARFVMTRTDELTMVAFCDRGGDLRNDTTRLSSGPLRPHPSNPGWKPPSFQRVRIRVQGGTGEEHLMVPPILWLPGPGPHQELNGHELPDPDGPIDVTPHG